MRLQLHKLQLHSPVQWMRWIGANAKRIAVFIAGVTVVAIGVALLVLPGPGLLVIIAGLAILATEFVWAERALDAAKARAKSATDKVRRRSTNPSPSTTTSPSEGVSS